MTVGIKWNTKNKFAVATCHYSHDPDKNTPEWIAKAKEGISERSWKREYEINYETFEGQPVFEEFKREVHVQNFEYDKNSRGYVYRGWDFGFHHPACVFWYYDQLDRMCVRHAILGHNETIKDFGLRISNFSHVNYPGAQFLDACDPAGHQKTDKADTTSVQVLGSLGIVPTSRSTHIVEGLEIIRQRLRRRNDGNVGVIVHPECQILIDACLGGYRYEEAKEGRDQKEEPLKDGWFDHIIDAWRYSVVNYLEVTPAYGSASQGVENDIMRGSNSIVETGDMLDFSQL